MDSMEIWKKLKPVIGNNVKVYLLKFYIENVLELFNTRLSFLVRRYCGTLPSYVVDSEYDDLLVVAQLEFVETVKVWDPEVNSDIWPLAQLKIVGAMKDHVRYLIRTNPSKVYDWIVDAGYLYQIAQSETDFSKKFETTDQLSFAMNVLTERERRVVILHVYHGFTFRRISEEIKLSNSQISRIYKKAVEKMRGAAKKFF